MPCHSLQPRQLHLLQDRRLNIFQDTFLLVTLSELQFWKCTFFILYFFANLFFGEIIIIPKVLSDSWNRMSLMYAVSFRGMRCPSCFPMLFYYQSWLGRTRKLNYLFISSICSSGMEMRIGFNVETQCQLVANEIWNWKRNRRVIEFGCKNTNLLVLKDFIFRLASTWIDCL